MSEAFGRSEATPWCACGRGHVRLPVFALVSLAVRRLTLRYRVNVRRAEIDWRINVKTGQAARFRFLNQLAAECQIANAGDSHQDRFGSTVAGQQCKLYLIAGLQSANLRPKIDVINPFLKPDSLNVLNLDSVWHDFTFRRITRARERRDHSAQMFEPRIRNSAVG